MKPDRQRRRPVFRKKRKKKRKREYAEIIYRGSVWIFPGDHDSIASHHSKIVRSFRSYAAAITHLTNVKLGLEEETPPWCHYKPVKVVAYTRHKGKDVVQFTKVLEEKEKPESWFDEHTGVRWDETSGRFVSPGTQHKFPLPETFAISFTDGGTYDSRRSRAC